MRVYNIFYVGVSQGILLGVSISALLQAFMTSDPVPQWKHFFTFLVFGLLSIIPSIIKYKRFKTIWDRTVK